MLQCDAVPLQQGDYPDAPSNFICICKEMSAMSSNYEIRSGTAVITFDFPPVNGLGSQLRSALLECLDRANADTAVTAVVITGTGKAFSGGADVKEFGTPAASREPRLPLLISALEDSPKPVVAAIAGICMGGGLELAMGAHYRVARADARLALPEVKLGLLPGAGGTQRLPRAIGLERALNMILSGETLPASAFKGSALLDDVTEGDVVDAAVALAQRVVAEGLPRKRLRDLKVQDPQAEAFLQFARNMVAAGAGPYPAPLRCLQTVALSVSKPFDEALRLEREAFLALMGSVESRALRHVFGAERAAGKIANLPDGVPLRNIDKIGVIGAGTMGGGISMNFLNAGIPVVLLETQQEALDRGLATIRRNYENSAKKGKLTSAQVEQRMALLTPTLDYAALADADLVIEAVFENMDVKQTVFSQLDKVCKQGAILASNTSYLDIDKIAGFTTRPRDVLGLHFFSPANVMRLLEVVRGAQTAPDVLATSMALARKIGKIAVVSGVCDGFIGNRMLAPYGAAAQGLINAGALPQQIDGALQTFGMAMGPFRMGDLAGLDIGWATRKRKAAEAGKPFTPIATDKLCEAGRFGQKTGAGWYRYEAGKRDPIPDPVTEQVIAEYRAANGITPRKVSDTEVVERCIYALINEGARILQEGIAARASDIDLVYLNGYGFPRHRGGPMLYADTVGLSNVVRALQRFAAEPGADPSWQPAPLLLQLAAQGKTFN
jgi:3-hydroxyacyl-CoA dehydrogenase